MAYDLEKVLSYGQKIGAEKALIIDDSLSRYYKKGDKASKHCMYFYGKSGEAKLGWGNSFEFCLDRVVNFYKNLGHAVEVIDIPKENPA
ncbi:TPA: hypothetical protein ACNII0_002916 [Acinetobacter baumannii]|uniref:hypothetical protein n=1 Tax=Acinetobacter baumannii TaxID=470 RepID=UPI0013D60EE3|nr:hypothetical protein [Acinetobacter baumannii]MCL8260972.1 hypothetical protein [Acinetobacter baumannii]MDA5045128.1 hypothetical protein [Acinetobacter baumannii]MDC4754094.1 hypothetical protein [Acinetobacter baumannii]HEM6660724.1 hypothetical protein [Acinetobacter baumannii]